MNSGRLNLTDKATIIYNLVVAAIIVLFARRIPSWHWLLLLNIGVIAAILFWFSRITEQSHRLLRLLRSFYPMFFFLAAYEQTERMNRVIFSEFLDPYFQRVEYMIFGSQPALALAQKYQQRWLSEYMHFAYFSYYLQFPALGLMFYLRKERRVFEEYIFTLASSFYVYYLIYIALPVVGGPSLGADKVAGGPFAYIMGLIYDRFELGGAAFPSSHVGIALLVLCYAIQYLSSRTAFIFGILGVSLMISTVYCGYHYVIDVIAGLATGIALTLGWRRVFRSLSMFRGGSGS